MIQVNGIEHPFTPGQTLADLLTNLDFSPTRIALELNKEIIPREAFAQALLHDGDHVEIVQFVGGG